jgi:alpha-tubulin suppressor-like RCC1 family protein
MARFTPLRLLGVLCVGVIGPLAGTAVVLATPASATLVPTTLLASGVNSDGQLGVGEITGPQTCSPTACATSPVSVDLPAGVKAGAVITGSDVAYTVGSDGNLYAWGDNTVGQLGIGTSTGPQTCGTDEDYCSPTPVTVDLPSAALPPSQVVTSGSETLAIGANHVLYGWGNDTFGILGNGATAWPDLCETNVQCAVTPVPVALPGGATPEEIAIGSRTGFAVGSDGHLYAWGFGEYGELGSGYYSDDEPSPPAAVDLPVGATPTNVFAGDYSVFADTSDGSYSWGYNYYGQLGHGENLSTDGAPGDNTNTFIDVPWTVDLPAGVQLSSVQSTDFYTTYAIGTDSNLYVWGNNESDFGNGSTATASTSPIVLTLPDDAFPVAIAAYLAIGWAVPSVYVVGSDETLYVWGQSADGEFGNGGAASQYIATPTAVPGLTNVENVAAGASFSLIEATIPPLFSLAGDGIKGAEDVPATLKVATITPNAGSPTTFTAIIDWGDGTPNSTGTVVASGSGFLVEGSHAYASTGSFTITTTVTGTSGPSQSVKSHDVVSTPLPPTTTAAAPHAIGQGAVESLALTGTQFTTNNSATVSFSSTGVTVNSVTFDSPTKLSVKVTVAKTAAPGARNVTVTTPGGAGTCTGCLTVDVGPAVTSITGSLTPGVASAVTVKGSGFVSGLTAKTDIAGATVGSPSGLTATSFGLSITVPSGTATGKYKLIVTNPDKGTTSVMKLSVR